MKKRKFFIASSIIVSFLIVFPSVVSCTVFHVSNDSCAFGGNNEDYSDPDTHIYFYPPTANKYGKVIVGYSGVYKIQGGMNEKGLFWDGLGMPYLEVKNSTDKPYFYNGNIMDYILDTCDTCDDVLNILDQYNLKIFEYAQIFIGDKYGDSFIIEGDIIHRKSEYYQVATNFYLSQYPDPPYPGWRYNIALEMFENNPVENISVDFCASVLDAVHQEGAYPTQYSNVYDLKNGLIHLYYNHNYNSVKTFNLIDEFNLGYHSYSIPELFEHDSQPPYKPNKSMGLSQSAIGKKCYYSSSTIDPDGDIIYYLFDWGDGTDSGWQGPFNSGDDCNISHIWNEKGSYQIKVKAKDMYDLESDWSDPLLVSMPKTKIKIISNLYKILQSFLYFFDILLY
ncbi:MAG: hypothetical protein DRN27_10115 [Thermoplasmata archaeon]|nr:MAG: hypothetical protein DRN27_10115 [Thermoplasmata archaeon]